MKKAAAMEALEFVKPGMNLGLGTGSTANHFIEALGAKVKEGLDVKCVPTSKATRGHGRKARHSAHHARCQSRISI